MSEKERIIALLRKDLENGYGVALRYLFMANDVKMRGDKDTATILYELASDSVSHSLLARKMLKSFGVTPPSNFTVFHSDIPDVDKSLSSSYMIERKMAKDYNMLAKELGQDHESYRLLKALGRFEGEHMIHVMNAIKTRRERADDDVVQGIEIKLQELEKAVMEDMHIDTSFPEYGDVERESFAEEAKIVEALDKFTEPGILDRLSEKALAGDFEDIGVPAEEFLEEQEKGLIWDEEEYIAYCMRCKENYSVVYPAKVLVADNRPGVKGKCAKCGGSVFALV